MDDEFSDSQSPVRVGIASTAYNSPIVHGRISCPPIKCPVLGYQRPLKRLAVEVLVLVAAVTPIADRE
jgi:hypothetical protein